MKKWLCLLLCVCMVLFVLVSCGTKDEKVYLVEQIFTNKNETIKTTYFYDNEYMVVRMETASGEESDTVSELGYDANGYQNYQKTVAQSGMVQEVFRTNDDLGRVVEQRELVTYKNTANETISKYEYTDSNGSFVQTYVEGSNKGRTVTVLCDEKGNEISRKDSLGQSAIYNNEYDGVYLIKRESIVKFGSSSITTLTKYQYDEKGNLIKESNYDDNGNLISTQEYVYSSKISLVD